MIKVARQTLPPAIETALSEKRTALRAALESGQTPSATLLDWYREPNLKQHLVGEAHGKCIYCESKITQVYFGDVEHIKPKTHFPAERLSIENLGLACAQCNNAKGEFWDDERPVLNPYVDDPSVEILPFGVLVLRRPGRERARLTIELLKLNRQALMERRKERIELLEPLVDQYVQAPVGALKDLLRRELCQQASGDREYAAVIRAYLEAACQVVCDNPN